jgi:hypothetical protein
MCTNISQEPGWKTLAKFTLSSPRNSEPSAQEQVAATVGKLNLSAGNLERLKSGVAEAILSASNWPELPVFIRVLVSERVTPAGTITQDGEPARLSQTPDLTAKVTEQPLRREWGFFLIHKMKNEREACYTIELFLYREDEMR